MKISNTSKIKIIIRQVENGRRDNALKLIGEHFSSCVNPEAFLNTITEAEPSELTDKNIMKWFLE